MSLTALAALVFTLAWLLVLHRRLSVLPHAVLALVRKERAQDAGRLLDAMTEAVAARSGQAVVAIQACQEQIAQSLRAQLAEAEARARVAERRALDTATALEAATTLVRELRATLDVGATLVRHVLANPSVAAVSPPASARPTATPGEPDDAERKTTEMPPIPDGAPASGRQPRATVDDGGGAKRSAELRPQTPVADPSRPTPENDGGGFDDEDERTKVAERCDTLAALRRVRRSPTVLPPAPDESDRVR